MYRIELVFYNPTKLYFSNIALYEAYGSKTETKQVLESNRKRYSASDLVTRWLLIIYIL